MLMNGGGGRGQCGVRPSLWLSRWQHANRTMYFASHCCLAFIYAIPDDGSNR
jgi:hypothetical protein